MTHAPRPIGLDHGAAATRRRRGCPVLARSCARRSRLRATACAPACRCSASRGASSRSSCCSPTAKASIRRSLARLQGRVRRRRRRSCGRARPACRPAASAPAGRSASAWPTSRLLDELPLVKAWSPEYHAGRAGRPAATKLASYRARGVAPSLRRDAHETPAPAGRFIDDEDVRLQRRVVFLGSEVAAKLFGNRAAGRRDHPHHGHGVRGDRRAEGEGAALQLLPARQGVRVHPVHDGRRSSGTPSTSTCSSIRPSIRRCDAKAHAAGQGSARQAAALQPGRRARACASSAPPSRRRSPAASCSA